MPPLAEYRKNHLTAQAYLAPWTGADGLLCRVKTPNASSELRRPATVGYREDFWGRDPAIRRHAEKWTSEVEASAASLLADLHQRWPLTPGSDEWFSISRFLGLHLLRNPAGPEYLAEVQRGVLSCRLRDYTSNWTDEQTNEFLELATSDRFRVNLLLDQAHKAASMVGSMHWSLIEFREPLLATSDQPFAVVPLLDEGQSAPVLPLLRGPMFNAEEMRIAIGPHRALLLTWLNQPCDGSIIQAGDEMAAELNRPVIGQADQEWFHHPDRRPTTLAGPLLDETACTPIGRKVHDGYGYHAALVSPRRMRAIQTMDRLVDATQRGRIEIVSVEPKAA